MYVDHYCPQPDTVINVVVDVEKEWENRGWVLKKRKADHAISMNNWIEDSKRFKVNAPVEETPKPIFKRMDDSTFFKSLKADMDPERMAASAKAWGHLSFVPMALGGMPFKW